MVRKFGPLYHQLVLLHLHQALERLERRRESNRSFSTWKRREESETQPRRRAFGKLPEVVSARATVHPP